jgi:hypothetical protein
LENAILELDKEQLLRFSTVGTPKDEFSTTLGGLNY